MTPDTLGSFQLRRIIRLTPLAYWKVDVAQPAVTTRQSNSLLLNADLKMPFKADSATIIGFKTCDVMSTYEPTCGLNRSCLNAGS